MRGPETENINSAAVKDVSSEQRCTVTEIKSDWFEVKLKRCLSKAKRSMTLRGSLVTVRKILDERIL